MAQQPLVGRCLPIIEAHDHTQTHHTHLEGTNVIGECEFTVILKQIKHEIVSGFLMEMSDYDTGHLEGTHVIAECAFTVILNQTLTPFPEFRPK
jgi:hypothetical protein